MLRGLLHRAGSGAAERSIFEHLEAADGNTLRRTKQLVAFAVLYEHEPRGRLGEPVAWPPLHVIVNGALQGMKSRGWAPAILMAHPSTPGVKRQLRQGTEVADGAGLTHAGHNAILAQMLAPIVDVNPIVDWRAMAVSGDSVALGANVVAIVAI